MNNKSTRVSAMVAGLATFLCATLGFAQDFGALRAQGGVNCANVSASITSATATCPDWVNVAACITVAAGNDGPACTTMSAAALLALSGARSACNTQAGRNASQAAEIADLDRRLQACRNQRPAATARRPVSVPICRSEPEFGGAATVLRIGREQCVVQVDPQHPQRVLQVISGDPHVCTRPDFRAVTGAGCHCPYGQVTRLGRSSQYFCAAVAMADGRAIQVDPSGVTPQATTNANAQQDLINRLTQRLDAMCLHVLPGAATVMTTETTTEATATTEGASASTTTVSAPAAPAVNTECPNLYALLNERGFQASGNGGQVNTAGLDQRVATLENTVAEHGTEIRALRRDVNALRRSFNWALVGGIEAGAGVIDGMTPVYGIVGFRARARIGRVFSLRADVLTILGNQDAPMVGTVVGYGANVGVGVGFETGSIRHDIDLMFAIRSLGDPGYHEGTDLERGILFGDYRGMSLMARISYLINFSGFGVEPSLMMGMADTVYGNVVRRGNQRVAQFGNMNGFSVLGGASFSWGN